MAIVVEVGGSKNLGNKMVQFLSQPYLMPLDFLHPSSDCHDFFHQTCPPTNIAIYMQA